ncbi:hypothetical protein ACFL3B_05650 [Gemmatimonadota bacterium]
MVDDRASKILLLVLLLFLQRPNGVFGQAEYSFRFHAAVGDRVHTISRSDIFMRAVRGYGSALDSVTVESERMESLTSWVEATSGGRFSALLVYDSIMARTRSRGGRWLDITPTVREGAISRVVLTNRFEVLGAEFVDVPHLDASVAEVMRGVGAGVHLELPENPVSVGQAWSVDLTYPLTVLSGLGRDEGVPISGGLETNAVAKLDSVVFRVSDTLAYMTVVGQFVPKSDDGIVFLSGNLASTLVWSSGWPAYASAATRAIVVVQRRRSRSDPVNVLRVRFDIFTQTRVRT